MAGTARALGLCGAMLIAGAAAGGDWTFYRHDAFGTSNA
jgi:hypothetical protein